jgi:hypothetical protein
MNFGDEVEGDEDVVCRASALSLSFNSICSNIIFEPHIYNILPNSTLVQ